MITGLATALFALACAEDSPTDLELVVTPSAAVVAESVADLAVVSSTDSTVTVRWTEVGDGSGGAANYRLKYATPPIDWKTATIGCDRTLKGTTPGAVRSCTVDGLAPGTEYDFQLMSYRGSWQGAVYSNVATGRTTVPTAGGAAAVDDLSLVAATASSVTVGWTEVDDGTGSPARYRVKFASPPLDWSGGAVGCDVDGTQIGAAASCTITGLSASTDYEAQLMSYRMVDGVWQGAVYSNVVAARTATPTPTNGTTVSDLSVAAATDSSFTVRWTQVDDGAGSPARYRVKFAAPPIDWSSATVGCDVVGTQIGAAASCTIGGLAASADYEVQLMSYRLVNGAWQGAVYSNVAAGRTADPASALGPVTSDGGIWISRAQVAAIPTSGTAWNNLLNQANASCGLVDLTDQEDTANVCVMAKALVFARTGEARYRTDVITSLTQVVQAPAYSGRALALGRELAAYVIAADLIDLEGFNPLLDGLFRTTIRTLLEVTTTEAGTLRQCHERRPNNWGTHCGASRMAVAAYLGDTAELDRAARVFRGWLGERQVYAGFSYGDLSWQCDSSRPVGINPAGCTRNGQSIDGVLPDDQRRGGGFTWPAPKENYVWEALQGALAQAVILDRAGYDVWAWGDRALLRAVRWLHDVNGYPAEGDDTWQPHVVNSFYGTSFPAPMPARAGKNVGWTDWTHR